MQRCDAALDLGDPALPVAGTGRLAGVRKSRTGRWRALVLAGVHAIVALHVAHFVAVGRTLSPVEPSEAMYTFELGRVNAGFVFLLAALALTLVFGRFFCGWGCHIVALQDLCGWLMKRLGIRPRPFRSRLLVWAPLALALYMFVWPFVKREWLGIGPAFPGFSSHLTTAAFWSTFPGPLFAVLTFAVCGFAAVYFLGAKGFCTYGCPYGGLFGLAGRFAPGRIVVSDACEGCGHCTATCTSNVLVHEEVRLYGQVVDPGCMKCMDCVSVCPKGALSFGFAWPKSRKGRKGTVDFRGQAIAPVPESRLSPYQSPYHYGIAEELLLAMTFVGSLLAFRGLYDGPPLLMSAGLAGITAFLALKSVHLLLRPTVRLQNLTLKLGRHLTPQGWIVSVLAAAWLAFTAHSAFVQWHRAWGGYWLARTEGNVEDVLLGAVQAGGPLPQYGPAAAQSFRHFALADRWGLRDVAEVDMGLAWGHLLRGETDAAEARMRRVIDLAPGDGRPRDYLIALLTAGGRIDEALQAARDKLERLGSTGPDEFQIAGLLVETGALEEAAAHYARAIEIGPVTAPLRYNFGGTLRRLGRTAEAVEQLAAAAELDPQDADIRAELELARAGVAP